MVSILYTEHDQYKTRAILTRAMAAIFRFLLFLLFGSAAVVALRPVDIPRQRALLLPVAAVVTTLSSPPALAKKEEQKQETLDPATVKKYKAIYAAKEKMPKEQQTGYMKKVCDSGVLGPSILGLVLCSGK